MTTESLDKTKIKESIENIRKALRAYKEEIDKKNKKTIPANNDHVAETRDAVIQRNGLFNDNSFTQNIKALFEQAEEKLKQLEDAVNSTLGCDENMIRERLIPILEDKIKEIEQQVKEKYLPTYLHEIYEVIKTLLGKLIVWFSTPLPGEQQQVHRFAQTISSTHSSVVYEFKNMEKTLFSRNTKDRNPATRGFVNEGMNELESKLLETISGLQQQLQVMQERIDSMQRGSVEDNKQLTERVETLEEELASVKTTAEAAESTASLSATKAALGKLSEKVGTVETTANAAATKVELDAVKATAEAAESTASLAATKAALGKLSEKVGTVETTANAAATKVELADVKATAEAAKSTASLAAAKVDLDGVKTTVDEVKEELTAVKAVTDKVPAIGRAVESIRAAFYYRMRDYGTASGEEIKNVHGLGQTLHTQRMAVKLLASAVAPKAGEWANEANKEIIARLDKQYTASLFSEAAGLSPTPYRTEEEAKVEADFLRTYPRY